VGYTLIEQNQWGKFGGREQVQVLWQIYFTYDVTTNVYWVNTCGTTANIIWTRYETIGPFFYSQIWLKTTWNMFKIDKKRNGWRTIFKRNFLVHWLFFNKVKWILY
jgi:hypothetical protein